MSVVNELQKLFGDYPVTKFNPNSQAVFKKLNHCHTALAGCPLYRCSQPDCNKEKLQYHPDIWQPALPQLRKHEKGNLDRRTDQ